MLHRGRTRLVATPDAEVVCPTMNRYIRAALAALLAFAAADCASSTLPPASGPAVVLRREPSLDGVLAEFPKPGRVTLVDFWATSCEPCKAMMPAFQKLWTERKGEGLDVIGVASDDNPGLVSEHVKALGVGYPQVVDANAGLRGDFRVAKVPHSVVIDRKGRVRLSLQGGKPEDVERIVSAAKAALEEQP